MSENLTVIILTFNEEHNIGRCLESLRTLDADVCVVDSGSKDKTVSIAREFGARVFVNPWVNHATQFNWALANVGMRSPWVLRLDADEYLTPELAGEIRTILPGIGAEYSGVLLRRRVVFLGRWIRFGGRYPQWSLRIFRPERGKCEDANMDEQIVLDSGSVWKFSNDFVDENLKDLTFWTDKHNSYASKEVVDYLEFRSTVLEANLVGKPRRVRWLKNQIYYRTPLFIRPIGYWFYRYFVRLGFLDGVEGLIFHFLQGFWYRFLVDAKIFEKRKK